MSSYSNALAAAYLSDARARAQARHNIAVCVSLVDTGLYKKIEKQLSGEMPPGPEQDYIMVKWRQHHIETLRLSETLPAIFPGPGPWIHSNDMESLQLCFVIFDAMIFEGRLSRIVDLEWSDSIEAPGWTLPNHRPGHILILMRKQGTNDGLYSGRAAVAVMKALLGQMCWAYLAVDRCSCLGCTERKWDGHDQGKWIRLYGLVLHLAGRDLGLLFENGFPLALEKVGPRAGQY